jgi:adenylate cyclase
MKLGKLNAMLKKHAPLFISLGIAMVFAMTTIIIESDYFEFGPLSKKGLVHLLDLKSLDVKFQTRKMPLPEPKVVIAAIDEKGVERYGLWPWSRSVIAQFVRTVTQGGAKVIAFDAVFGDEDRNASWMTLKRFAAAYDESGLGPTSELGKQLSESVVALSKAYALAKANLVDAEQKSKGAQRASVAAARKELDRIGADLEKAQRALTAFQQKAAKFRDMLHSEVAKTSPDDDLADAISTSPQTILGFIGFISESEIVGVSNKRAKEGVSLLASAAIDTIYDQTIQDVGGAPVETIEPAAGVDISNLQIRSLAGVLPPLEKFSKVAKGFGSFNAAPDADGQMRRVWLLQRFNDRLYPALSVAAVARYFDSSIYPLKNPIYSKKLGGLGRLNPSGGEVPADFHGRLLLNYYTNPETYFQRYSVADIIEGKVPASAYKDKVVFFGMTAQALFDLKPTPFSATTPGVYVHATAVQNMIDGLYLDRFFGIALVEAAAYLLLGLMLGLILPRIPVWAGFLVSIGIITMLYIIDLKLIFPRGVWVMNVLPTLQTFTTYLGVAVYGYLTEGKEKRQIRKAFQFYLSKSVVEEVLKDPDKLKLGGVKLNATVMFSDVRGFTTISEKLSPEALVSLLNSYLTPMTDVVLKYEGTLDKYIGDAIMAIFGAPVNYPDHAARACRVCLEMMDRLHELQVGWRAQQLPDIDIGIGVNTGPVSAGNMGSLQRFDYTVMGDNVNLASRLEGINKVYGTNINVSESTFEAAKHEVYAREVDAVRVKGKHEPVKIYEVLGLGTPSQGHADLVGEFQRGLAL